MQVPDPIALLGMCITVIGWPLSTYLAYRFGLRSQRIQRAEAAKQEASAGVSKWRLSLRGIAAATKAQIVRAQTPSDWFREFEAVVIELKRMAVTVPGGFDPKKRTEVVAAVDQLCAMSAGDGSEAVYGAQKVVDLLQRLEDLTNDA